MTWEIRKTVVAFTLITITGISWWLSQSLDLSDHQTVSQDNDGVDYFIENFSSTVMNIHGRPKYILKGMFLTHYLQDRPAHLEQPTLTQFLDDGVRVHTSAQTGWLSRDGKKLIMEENVKVIRTGPNNKAPSEITTGKITILLDR